MTLFSFTSKKEKVFTLQSDGNYKVDADNMSDADIAFLLENTQDYKGAKVFKKTIVFHESATDDKVKETVAASEKATDVDQPADPSLELVAIIAKYNQ